MRGRSEESVHTLPDSLKKTGAIVCVFLCDINVYFCDALFCGSQVYFHITEVDVMFMILFLFLLSTSLVNLNITGFSSLHEYSSVVCSMRLTFIYMFIILRARSVCLR